METNLPAGLINKKIELFKKEETFKGLYDGKVLDFHNLPDKFMNDLLDYYNQDTEAQQELRKHSISDVGELLTVYAVCKFGGFDRTPDYDNGHFTPEYWACPKRGDCPYHEKLCAKVRAKNGKISRKEISVIQLIAKGLPMKQIADKLFISYDTVRTHVANIHRKLDAHNNADVTRFAFRNNLIK